MSNNITIK